MTAHTCGDGGSMGYRDPHCVACQRPAQHADDCDHYRVRECSCGLGPAPERDALVERQRTLEAALRYIADFQIGDELAGDPAIFDRFRRVVRKARAALEAL